VGVAPPYLRANQCALGSKGRSRSCKHGGLLERSERCRAPLVDAGSRPLLPAKHTEWRSEAKRGLRLGPKRAIRLRQTQQDAGELERAQRLSTFFCGVGRGHTVAGPRSTEEGDRAKQESTCIAVSRLKKLFMCIPVWWLSREKKRLFWRKSRFSLEKRPQKVGFLVKKAVSTHSGVRSRGSLQPNDQFRKTGFSGQKGQKRSLAQK